VPDWLGLDGSSTADRYRLMAEREVRGISPSYEALCLGVAGDRDLVAALDSLPRPKRQPNLLLAAVRYLGGPVDSWPAFRVFVLDSWDAVSTTMLARRTQTNEAARCASLLPVLAGLPQPLALLEVGASAGLCLLPDRYAYRYAGPGGERTVGTGPLLRCEVTGDVPVPQDIPAVVWRAGLDLNPLDVTSDDDVRWLESLVWPEQTDRTKTLRSAVAVARTEPPRVERGDLLADLPTLAAQADRDATLVVYHSAVLAYVDRDGRSAFAATMADLAAARPTVWVSNEAPGVVADADVGDQARFVLARDGEPLALAGPHGATLDWLG
jgi:hypothetical protein